MNFKDKVVIITGGSNGIGKAIAKEYAHLDAIVIIADIDEKNGKTLEKELTSKGIKAKFYLTDFSKPSDIESMVQQVVSTFGRIDILINNVGKTIWKSPYELSIEEWDHIINTNLRSYFICSREVAKVMKTDGEGKIVNIASTRAVMSEKHSEAYAASKGGILSLTHALASSFAVDNIQVNAISPGWIEQVITRS